MKQKYLSLEVSNSDGSVIYSKSQAVPQDVMAVLALFTDADTMISVSVHEIDVSVPNSQQN